MMQDEQPLAEAVDCVTISLIKSSCTFSQEVNTNRLASHDFDNVHVKKTHKQL